ncbi:MAG: hypothetical protein LAP38_25940 [Acidobacteriia bacterium]|nr:hypothetical protein [Terriglobia bacterium]
MKVKITKTTGRVFEYFLYTAMILETGLAAFVFKVSSPETDFFHLRFYLGILYFSFLGWCIVQLNRVHRYRRQLTNAAEPAPAVASVQVATDAPPDLETPAAAARTIEPVRLVFGLTGSQFMVVLVVFLTALVTFSWALARMQPGKQ